MEFKILKENIVKHLQYAINFASSKNSITDILQCVYIELKDNLITLKTTNFNITYIATIETIESSNEGVFTVNCKILHDVLKVLPDSSIINFAFESNNLFISTNKTNFKLATLNSDMFPDISEIIPSSLFNIESIKLLNLLKKTYICLATDTNKVEYSGATLEINQDNIEIIATGLQRIAISSDKIDKKYSNDIKMNIPRKTITEILKIFDKTDTIEISTDEKSIMFKSNDITVISKLISKYPKGVNRLFANEYPLKIKFNRKEFIDSVKRVSSISNDDISPVSLLITNTNLELSLIESAYGSSKENLNLIESNIDYFTIGINSKQILEILSISESEYILFEMTDSKSPALLKPQDENLAYLIVPISFDSFN